MRIGHIMTSYAYLLSILMATFWHKFWFDCKFLVTFLLLTTNTALYFQAKDGMVE